MSVGLFWSTLPLVEGIEFPLCLSQGRARGGVVLFFGVFSTRFFFVSLQLPAAAGSLIK